MKLRDKILYVWLIISAFAVIFGRSNWQNLGSIEGIIGLSVDLFVIIVFWYVILKLFFWLFDRISVVRSVLLIPFKFINKIFKKIPKIIKPFLTPTNILLLLLILTVFSGFYYSSPYFRRQIRYGLPELINSTKIRIANIGISYKKEKIGQALFICSYGMYVEEIYSQKLKELNRKINEESLKPLDPKDFWVRSNGESKTLSLLKIDKENLIKEGKIQEREESFEVIRKQKYRFWWLLNEEFNYKDKIPENCKCKDLSEKNECGWEAYEQPISM